MSQQFLLDYDLNEVPELVLLPDGEYELRVAKVEAGPSKKGTPMLTLYFQCPDEPNSETILDYFPLPIQGVDDERATNQKLRRIKHFCMAFRVPSQDIADWVGLSGMAIVRTEVGKEGYSDKNRIAKYCGGME